MSEFVRQPLPEIIAGVYGLLRGEKLVYVGKSLDITTRICSHIREGIKVFDGCTIIELPGLDPKALLGVEMKLIVKYKPEYNYQVRFPRLANLD